MFVQTGAKFPKLFQVSGENDDQSCNGMGFVIGRQTQMSCSEFRNHHEMGLSENRLAPNQLVNVSFSFPIELQFCWYTTILRVTQVIYVGYKSHEPPLNYPHAIPTYHLLNPLT
jgi:hypothetical protein